MDGIVRVHAARKGTKIDKQDFTHYVLIVTLSSGQKVNILETKNDFKIRKEVSD